MSEHPMQAGATEQSPKEFLCILWGGGGGGGGEAPLAPPLDPPLIPTYNIVNLDCHELRVASFAAQLAPPIMHCPSIVSSVTA